MIELVRTNDVVFISWLTSRLDGAGIGHAVLDTHTSILEGSIGAIPRRIMVVREDEAAARTILESCPGFRPQTAGHEPSPLAALRPDLVET